jgi:hypothetical protein
MKKDEGPLFKGGQGRSNEEIASIADAIFLMFVWALVLGLCLGTWALVFTLI